MAEGSPPDAAPDDFSDVPLERKAEAQELVRLLRVGLETGDPGGPTELREWLGSLNRMSGFSRLVTLELCSVITNSMGATRSRTAQPSRVDVQQTFVRMGGVKDVVNAMLLRLNDSTVVAACTRTLSASCQGSPLAAEAVMGEKRNVRLLMRAIERHAADAAVAQAGCVLIGHLCAETPRPEFAVMPARARAHRETQYLVAETGALDLIVEILASSLLEVKEVVTKAETLQAANLKKEQQTTVPGKGVDAAKDKIGRVKANMELQVLWSRYISLEAVAGPVQDAALQALVLIITGNAETTRMLAGVLWAWQSQRNTETSAGVVKRLAEAMGATQAQQRQPQGRQSLGGRGSKEKMPPTSQPQEAVDDGLPQGEARRALTTLQALTVSMGMVVEVLRGRVSRDRPLLAAKACRLISMLALHHEEMLSRVQGATNVRTNEMAVRLRPGDLPPNDRRPEAPFAPLQASVSALVFTMRTHRDNAPLCAAALEALARLRIVALKSAPGGIVPEGESVRCAWQVLLAGSEEKYETKVAGQTLRKAIQTTDLANQRMVNLRVTPDQLAGEGAWLTPRMREAAERSVEHADTFCADIVAAAWQKGDPTRRAERAKRPKLPPAAASPPATANSRGSKGKKNVPEEGVLPDEPPPTQWTRALGYLEHDQEDFDLVWKKPLQDIMSRSFSTPAIPAPSQTSINVLGADTTAPMVADVTNLGIEGDALDQLLDIELVHSEPGKLKVRCVVNPVNRVHMKVADIRMRELTEPGNLAVTAALCKTLRKNGALLPKYGLQVTTRRGRAGDLDASGERRASGVAFGAASAAAATA